jgi:hypothetical protein
MFESETPKAPEKIYSPIFLFKINSVAHKKYRKNSEAKILFFANFYLKARYFKTILC